MTGREHGFIFRLRSPYSTDHRKSRVQQLPRGTDLAESPAIGHQVTSIRTTKHPYNAMQR